MVVVLQAIERVGEKDRTTILDDMFATEGFVSLLGGTWSFTENGDTDSNIIGLAQVVDGVINFQVGDLHVENSELAIDYRAGSARPGP